MRLLETTAPSEVDAPGLAPSDALLLGRACRVRGVLFHGPAPASGRPLAVARRGRGLRAIAGLVAPSAAPPPPLLEAISAELWRSVVPVTLAELPRWETRRVRGAAAAAEVFLRDLLGRLRGTPGLAESYAHREVHFADLAGGDLEALLLEHLPAVVRRMEAAIEILASAHAAAVLLAVPGRDERRALVHACAAAGVGAVTVRLGAPAAGDAVRADGGPQPLAALDYGPGDDPGPVVARLREAAHGRVGAG